MKINSINTYHSLIYIIIKVLFIIMAKIEQIKEIPYGISFIIKNFRS